MEGVEAFLFFLALRGEAKREEVRARFPRLVPLLKALGEAVEGQGETFRLAKPLRLSWFAPLFRARYSPLLPEAERALALERLVEAAFRSAEAGEPLVDGEGLLKAARLFQAGSQALLKGDHREALHRLPRPPRPGPGGLPPRGQGEGHGKEGPQAGPDPLRPGGGGKDPLPRHRPRGPGPVEWGGCRGFGGSTWPGPGASAPGW